MIINIRYCKAVGSRQSIHASSAQEWSTCTNFVENIALIWKVNFHPCVRDISFLIDHDVVQNYISPISNLQSPPPFPNFYFPNSPNILHCFLRKPNKYYIYWGKLLPASWEKCFLSIYFFRRDILYCFCNIKARQNVSWKGGRSV